MTGDRQTFPVQTMSARTAGAWQSGLVHRVALAVVVTSLSLVLAAGAWLAVRGVTAAGAAERAEAALRLSAGAFAQGDVVSGAEHLSRASDELVRARRATADPVWALAATLPGVGDDVRAVRTVLGAGADVALALEPVGTLAAGTATVPGRSATAVAPDALLDLVRNPRLAPTLRDAHDRVAVARDQVALANSGSLDPRLAPRVHDVAEALDQGATALGAAAVGAELVPALLGPPGSPPLLVVVQTPAEVRTLGGLAGLVLVVEDRDGRPQVVDAYSGSSVPPSPEPLLTSPRLQAWYSLFGDRAGRYLVNATMLPDARDAAALLAAAHVRRGGTAPSGVVLTDLTVLARLLEVTGPVALPDGRSLSADDSDDLLQSRVYAEQPDPAGQDAFFAGAARAVVEDVLRPGVDGVALVRTAVEVAQEGRLSAWSSDAAVQARVEELGVTGDRLADPTAVGVFLNDGTSAKMQFFLRSSVTVQATRTTSGSTVRVELASALPPGSAAGLPDYVVGGYRSLGLERGAQRVQVAVVGPVGDGPSRWRVDGREAFAGSTVVDGRGAGALSVDVPPGATVVVEADLAGTAHRTGPLVVTPGVSTCADACP